MIVQLPVVAIFAFSFIRLSLQIWQVFQGNACSVQNRTLVSEIRHWCPKSESSVQHWTSVSKIGHQCLISDRALVSEKDNSVSNQPTHRHITKRSLETNNFKTKIYFRAKIIHQKHKKSVGNWLTDHVGPVSMKSFEYQSFTDFITGHLTQCTLHVTCLAVIPNTKED